MISRRTLLSAASGLLGFLAPTFTKTEKQVEPIEIGGKLYYVYDRMRYRVIDRGGERWYLGDSLHREQGLPAVITGDRKEWWVCGQLHREDGPAIEWSNGDYEWYLHGKFHRVGGPARWLWNGKTKHWYVDGKYHREDGPAIECQDGSYHWYLNGLRHREDGPASCSNASRMWYKNGLLHRLNGPAIEWLTNGATDWYVYGQRVNRFKDGTVWFNGRQVHFCKDDDIVNILPLVATL